MKSIKSLLIMIIGLATVNAYAQKFGFTNSAAIMTEVPEVKQAESNLKAYQEQLTKQGQIKVEALQAKYQDLARKEKQGEIAPKALQDAQEKLKAEEDELAKLEQEMQGQLAQKREVLLQPILDRINKGIQDVAKENGFSFIFDSSAGMLLYADESSDVTALVRTKLGLSATASSTTATPKTVEAKKEPVVKKQ